MKQIVIVSRYPYSPHCHIEGREYINKQEAEKMIKVFKARATALNQIQKQFGFGDTVETEKHYSLAELSIPDNFFKD